MRITLQRLLPQAVVSGLVGLSLCLAPAHAARAADAPKSSTRSASGAAAAEREAVSGAVAGVLVAALSEQLGGRTVSIKLDDLAIAAGTGRERSVSGRGRLTLEDDADQIAFRFSTVYDAELGNAGYPQVSLGSAGDDREVPNDTVLVRQLDDAVVARLAEDVSRQPARLQFDRITTVEAGHRLLRISASGIADFGRDGTSPAQVEALYDRRSSAWLRVNYRLDGMPDGGVPLDIPAGSTAGDRAAATRAADKQPADDGAAVALRGGTPDG